MDLSKYKNKYVKVDLINGYFYEGKCLNATDEFIEILDRKGKLITLTNNSISFIREIEKEKNYGRIQDRKNG